MFGLLPPSSSVTVFRLLWAAATAIFLPTAVLPVNAILSMPRCSARAWPVVWPRPLTTFHAPGGKPTVLKISASLSVDRGCNGRGQARARIWNLARRTVFSAGLKTMEQPAARAGATFHDNMTMG